jgi:hypothetical protein
MRKFTPGPWRVADEDGSLGTVKAGDIQVLHAVMVARSDSDAGSPIRKANTVLAAAAPDLLAACERALAIHDSVTQGQERELRVGYADLLRAAIEKATA